MIRTQSSVDTLRGQITFRTESTRISAAVPWIVPSPSVLSRAITVVVGIFPCFAAWATSSGLKAWMWTPGAASWSQCMISVYVSSVNPGWTPESRQISVTFRSYASRACFWIPALSWQKAPSSVAFRPNPQNPQRFLQMLVTCRFWFRT